MADAPGEDIVRQVPLRAIYATPMADDVARFVADTWPIGSVSGCRLLNRGYNDAYEVATDHGGRYVARFGGRRLRGGHNAGYETAFLAHLDASAVPVAAPVATGAGTLWTTALLAEGERCVVLFRYIDGDLPRAGSFADAHAQGATLALVHRTGRTFTGPESRFRLDADHLLHRPLAAIARHPSLEAGLRRGLDAMAARLAERLDACAGTLGRVHCHGDTHGGNARIRCAEGGQPVAIFFDFDDGGPGWIAYDLAVYLWNKVLNPETLELWPAFLAGYRSIEPISHADLEATRLFVALRHIWLMGDYAAKLPEWGLVSLPGRWFERQAAFLSDWEDRHLSEAALL